MSYIWNIRIGIGLFTLTLLIGCVHKIPSSDDWGGFERLSGEQIESAFRNVHDAAEVQDAANTSAVNHWYENGTFVTQWKNAVQSGTVKGQWFVKDDTRCVIIESGVESMQGETKCGPIYRKDGKYFTVNKDGSIHGIHTLSVIQ